MLNIASNIELKIAGMSCGTCVSHVTAALEAVAGVRSAQVDLGRATAQVEGDSLDTAILMAAVEDEGYQAMPIAEQKTSATELSETGCACCDS